MRAHFGKFLPSAKSGSAWRGSLKRLDPSPPRLNYWMTFATFAPGQVTAKHPCIAQFIVRLSAIEVPQRPGELESSIIEKVRGIPNSIYIDPELKIRHDQSRGFWKTFVAHFHNGRATAGFSTRTRCRHLVHEQHERLVGHKLRQRGDKLERPHACRRVTEHGPGAIRTRHRAGRLDGLADRCHSVTRDHRRSRQTFTGSRGLRAALALQIER